MLKEEIVVEKGSFINYSDKKEYTYCFKILDEGDIETLLELQDRTYTNLIDKDIYVPGTRETLMKDLTGEGLTGGIFAGEKLIAFSSIHFMEYDSQYTDIVPAKDVPIKDLMQAARYRYTSVDPGFIRNGLSNKIAAWMHDYILEHFPHIRYFVSMVSPRNYPSLRQQIDLKLKGRAFKKNAKGLDRIILFKDVKKESACGSKNDRIVDATENEAIKEIFEEGYLLTEVQIIDKKIFLTFSI